jgi:F-type H+-transporting ATPase subunit delta
MINNKQARREAKQLFRLCSANSALDGDRVRLVVEQLIVIGRRNSRTVLGHFLRLVRLDHDRHTARVESATPLSEELRAATHTNLGRLYGPGLTTVFSDRPSLIGGMRIQIGSDVYDGTLQAGLAALEECF